MKYIITTAVLALVLFSCKKNELITELKPEIYGVWEYENFSGYPFTNNYLPPGNGKIIVLTSKGVFERRQHDTVLYTGKYFLEEKKDCNDDKKKVHFTADDTNVHWDDFIRVESGKLIFSTSSCYADGGSATYRKLSSTP